MLNTSLIEFSEHEETKTSSEGNMRESGKQFLVQSLSAAFLGNLHALANKMLFMIKVSTHARIKISLIYSTILMSIESKSSTNGS